MSPDDATELARWAIALDPADLPDVVRLGAGVTVTDPALFLARQVHDLALDPRARRLALRRLFLLRSALEPCPTSLPSPSRR